MAIGLNASSTFLQRHVAHYIDSQLPRSDSQKAARVRTIDGRDALRPSDLFLRRKEFTASRQSAPISAKPWTGYRSPGSRPTSDRSTPSCSSSRETQADSDVASKDLLVIGPGVLGRLVAQMWMQEFPGASVIGQTLTPSHHADLAALGIKPRLKPSGGEQPALFPHVIFCAPPSGSTDYAAEVSMAGRRWDGKGGLLFTSSSALYDVDGAQPCNEVAGQGPQDSPSVPIGRSPRTDKLLRAEEAVVGAGGCVVRLGGLYLVDRGAHTTWLERGAVDSRPDYYLNLIHYKDAASLCVKALTSSLPPRVFMGCDNCPVTRQEVMDITLKSGKFEKSFDKFTGVDGPTGKLMQNDRTRSELEWEPEYDSFAAFMGVEL